MLATHLLPLGPHAWHLNIGCGLLGMALFFTLSGFLITNFLLHHTSVIDFLIRRFFRILPLAWVASVVALVVSHSPPSYWLAHAFFYENLPPEKLTDIGSHLWSLCVEMQFYVGVALLFAALRARGLMLLPLACLAITGLRVATTHYTSGITYYRVDEILAGCILALVHEGKLGPYPRRFLGWVNQYVVFALLLVSCHPDIGFPNYFRPYLAAMLVGATLFNGDTLLGRQLTRPTLVYIASISYALYVTHQFLEFTWLGEGTKLMKYAKRPLLLAAAFLVSHASTFYFEHPCIALGKRLSARVTRPRAA